MFRTRGILILVLSCCVFQGLSSFSIDIYRTNMHDRELDRKIGKRVFSYVHICDGNILDQWYYTTDLSRLLLVGEPKFFQSIKSRCTGIFSSLHSIGGVISLLGPLFDNRFENFISNVGKYSQQELQEAIEDTLLLTQYSTKAYAASKLLDNLLKVLEVKIAYIKDQVEHNYSWDQASLRSVKKSVAWTAGLIACMLIANKYKQSDEVKHKGSTLEFLGNVAILGLIPATYKTLKDSYKVLTTDPKAFNQYLREYEELLLFVDKLKFQLESDGSIIFELANGNTATLLKDTTSNLFKNDTLTFN